MGVAHGKWPAKPWPCPGFSGILALPTPSLPHRHAAMPATRFEFEKLQVHARSLDLLGLVREVCAQLPRGCADLRDQALRSARSVHLNIAEGAGKYRPGAKAERYVTARASANECAAALTEIRLFDLADRKKVDEALVMADRVCAMLTALLRRWDPVE